MLGVMGTALPAHALLRRYGDEHYTDCFTTEIAQPCTLDDFVAAFYTTWLFKAERLVLRLFLNARSSDADAVHLAQGKTDTFAVWKTEDRNATQLLLCPKGSDTRSWLMIERAGESTKLYFGSALLPGKPSGNGHILSLVIKAHRLYSRALLALARRKLTRKKAKTNFSP